MAVTFTDTQWASQALDGASLADVAQTISQMVEAGKTEWFPRYSYQTTGNAISSVMVTVDTRVTLPSWNGYSAAPQAEKDEWDRFCSALRSHEQGHLDIVTNNLSGIDAALMGKSVSDAAQAWQNALNALQAASDAYDASNNHGTMQGTIINVPASSSGSSSGSSTASPSGETADASPDSSSDASSDASPDVTADASSDATSDATSNDDASSS